MVSRLTVGSLIPVAILQKTETMPMETFTMLRGPKGDSYVPEKISWQQVEVVNEQGVSSNYLSYWVDGLGIIHLDGTINVDEDLVGPLIVTVPGFYNTTGLIAFIDDMTDEVEVVPKMVFAYPSTNRSENTTNLTFSPFSVLNTRVYVTGAVLYPVDPSIPL